MSTGAAMRQHDLAMLLGGGATAWALPACAQQPDRMRRIGWLELGYANDSAADDRRRGDRVA